MIKKSVLFIIQVKLLYNTSLFILMVIFISCDEEPTSSENSTNELESTLEQAALSDGMTGEIDLYFYDLDEPTGSPYVDAKFRFYSELSILSPSLWNADPKYLEISSVNDYLFEFSDSEFVDSMITLDEFDETNSGECTSISELCPDMNGDGELTDGGTVSNLYRFEKVNFNHNYTDVIKLSWDEENSRYLISSEQGKVGGKSPLQYSLYIGNSEKCESFDTQSLCEEEFDLGYCEWDEEEDECLVIEKEIFIDCNSDKTICERTCEVLVDEEDLDINDYILTEDEYEEDCIVNNDWNSALGNGVWDFREFFIDRVDNDKYDTTAEIYEDLYDSLVYETQINWNDLNGFTFQDCGLDGLCPDDEGYVEEDDGEGDDYWDDYELYSLENPVFSNYFFDQSEIISTDSIYAENSRTHSHEFIYRKMVLEGDALVFRASTDCNDDGQWTDAETRVETDCINGYWYSYPAETCTDINDDGFCNNEKFVDCGPDNICPADSDYVEADEGESDGEHNPGENFTDCSPDGTICDGDPDWVDNLGDNEYSNEDFIDCGHDNICPEDDSYEAPEFNSIEDNAEGNGVWDGDASFCDIGNGIQDPGEPFIDLNDSGLEYYEIGKDEFSDRNCNGIYDNAETGYHSEDDCTSAHGFWTHHTFCDIGNGQWDDAERCFDEEESNGVVNPNCEYENLYTLESKPEILMASWDHTNNEWEEQTEGGAYNGTAYEILTKSDQIKPRWPEGTSDLYSMIVEVADTNQIDKPIKYRDRIEVVYSYKFIENTIGEDAPVEYNILKTSWLDSDDERQTNYLLNRKDDETGNILSLTHDSYFALPSTTPGSSIDAGSFANYILYDEYPSEQVYLYTYGGLLRDGEKHQTYREVYSPTTYALYDVYETYEVSHVDEFDFVDCNVSQSICEGDDNWEDGMGNDTWDSGELIIDTFRIDREKRTVMRGPGLELVEINKVWLQKGVGIVKDEVNFRFNEPDDFDGFYRLEIEECLHCEEETSMARSGFFDNRLSVSFHDLHIVDDYSDEYVKRRTYGIQALPINIQKHEDD